jgi:DNA-binding NarL/FixJ family response regulator
MTRPRLLLADDHVVFLEGLKKILDPEFELVGEVRDGRSLIDAAKKHRPDVVVADVSMPHLNGIEAARVLRDAGLHSRIVLLTMHDDVVYATEALRAGVSGYVLKNAPSSELLTAIREALKGNLYVAPSLAKEVFELLSANTRRGDEEHRRLTVRQIEVLQLIVKGLSAKEIAHRLAISHRTAEHHKYNMMDYLGIKTTAELIQYAVKNNLVS